MELRRYFLYWGRGLLVAAVLAAVCGLSLGGAFFLYPVALVLLVLSVLCLIAGKKMPE
jgi:hypothetical protein